MDTVQERVKQLWIQGNSKREISVSLGISHTKITQILVSIGEIDTEESQLYDNGLTVEQIANRLGKKKSSVITRLPYTKGMYRSDNPTKNAIRIRKHRQRTLK